MPPAQPAVPTRSAQPPAPALRVCPECSGPIVRSCACVSCAHCGWGRCL